MFRVLKIIFTGIIQKIDQGSFSFFAKFLAYLMIFQSFIAPFRIEKSSHMPKNMAKIEEKSCSTCLKPIPPWRFPNSKPGFQVPNLSLSIYTIYMCATSKNDEKKSTLPKKFYMHTMENVLVRKIPKTIAV